MPRSRGTDVPQRQSLRCPPPVRTSRSNSDPLHNRPPISDRSPRLGSGRSTKGSYSDPVNQKKLGTRIAGLESQLEQAQEELKILKHQLISAEAAKKQAQQELQKKTITKPIVQEEFQTENDTDVFEVPVQEPVREQMINPSLDELKEAYDTEKLSTQAKEEEMNSRLNQLGEELKESKGNVRELNKKLEEVEGEKASLESEMKKLRVQTEQWRKAADAAATILAGAGGGDFSKEKVPERCGSMGNKHAGPIFEPHVGGYGGYMGSPGFADYCNDGGKRKGNSGIRILGDLWKKKGHK